MEGQQPQLQYDPPRNWWKIISIILIIIALSGFGYWGYQASRQDGYTQGFNDGNAWVVNYQTNNQKVFLFYENKSVEIPFTQLCGGGNG